MKRIVILILAFVLSCFSISASAQDKASKVYTVVVGHVVNLGWTASTGATSYNVYVSGTSGGPYAIIGVSNTTTFSDQNGIAGKKYFYVVTAVNTVGESGFSSEVSAALPNP